MRDWEEYARQRLRMPELTPERRDRIIQELAEQLEEFYSEAIARGLNAEEADDYACCQISGLAVLISDVREAEGRNRRTYIERMMCRAEEVLPRKRRNVERRSIPDQVGVTSVARHPAGLSRACSSQRGIGLSSKSRPSVDAV